jgi:hypothetical protein
VMRLGLGLGLVSSVAMVSVVSLTSSGCSSPAAWVSSRRTTAPRRAAWPWSARACSAVVAWAPVPTARAPASIRPPVMWMPSLVAMVVPPLGALGSLAGTAPGRGRAGLGDRLDGLAGAGAGDRRGAGEVVGGGGDAPVLGEPVGAADRLRRRWARPWPTPRPRRDAAGPARGWTAARWSATAAVRCPAAGPGWRRPVGSGRGRGRRPRRPGRRAGSAGRPGAGRGRR